MTSTAAAWGPLSHQLEKMRVLLKLRRLVLVWQGPEGDWKHMLRCREDMVPQAETRLLDDLFAVYQALPSIPWEEVLRRWHAPGGWFRAFEMEGGSGFYAAFQEQDSTPEQTSEWLNLALPALAAAANYTESRGAQHGQRQAILESAVSLSGSETEEGFRAYALRLSRRLFAARSAAWLSLSAPGIICLAVDSDSASTDEFWHLSRETLAALAEDKPVLSHVETHAREKASILACAFGAAQQKSVLLVRSRAGCNFSAFDQFTFAVFCRQVEVSLENRRLLLRLKSANAELTAAQARLVETARLQTLGEVASSVAHDFNNVLGALLGRVQLLQHASSEPTVQSSLTKMERILNDGEAVVKKLQEAARGRKPEARITLDGLVREVYSASEAVFRHEAQIKDRNIVWLTEFMPTGTVELAARLRPVLRQLLADLSAAVPADSVIELATGRPSGSDLFSITVANDPSVQDAMPVWQNLPGYAAFSLGMEQAGATLRATMGEGETKLHVNFAPQAPPSMSQRAAEPLRVLVVDDDRDVRDVLREMLLTAGHQVRVAEDGAEALQEFNGNEFDVVFTDLGMPGISGWQVAEHIKREAPDLPVVMVTGWGHQLDPMQVERSGVARVINKPFHWVTVLDTLQELGTRRSRAKSN